MKFKPDRRIIVAALAVTAALAWYIHYKSASNDMMMPVATVKTAVVEEASVPLEIKVIGTLSAKSIEISPEISGHVEDVLVSDGSQVKKGQPVIQLDDAIYKAKASSSRGQLAYSESNYKRMVLLGKQGAVSKQAIESAEADLTQKRAEALENDVMVKKMQLLAPFDGVIGKIQVNPGDYVTVGQSMVTLTDTNHLHIEYTVPEAYLPQLKMSQAVVVTSDTYRDKSFTGKVAFISPTINPANRSVQIYAEVDNKDHLLASGMFVTVRQSLGTQARTLMVPARSAVSMLDGQQVYKIVDAKAVPVSVKLGMRKQDMVEVTEGLTAGDVIVTDGQIKLKNGSPVKIES